MPSRMRWRRVATRLDADGDGQAFGIGCAGFHDDAGEKQAVGEAVLCLQEPGGVIGLAFADRHDPLQQFLADDVLLDMHRTEAIAWPGLEVQDDVGGARVGIHLEAALLEAGIEVTQHGRVRLEVAAQAVVLLVAQAPPHLDRALGDDLEQPLLGAALAENANVDRRDQDRLARVDLEARHPCAVTLLQQRLDPRPVVTEGAHRRAYLSPGAPVEPADGGLGQVLARAVPDDIERGADVLLDLPVDAGYPHLDLGGGRRPRQCTPEHHQQGKDRRASGSACNAPRTAAPVCWGHWLPR
jgi:hypothetical protein